MEKIDVTVPSVGESITEVIVNEWLVEVGGAVTQDEPLVVLETDKVTVDLPAPASGALLEILKANGDSAAVGEAIARIAVGAGGTTAVPAAAVPGQVAPEATAPTPTASQPAAPTPTASNTAAPMPTASQPAASDTPGKPAGHIMPAAARVLAEQSLDAGEVRASGPGGRLLKEDVLRHAAGREAASTPRPGTAGGPTPGAAPATPPRLPIDSPEMRHEEIVPMTPLRKRVAERLVESQRNAALLTTFNEIDMTAVIRLRTENQEAFQSKYGIKLGFMSFFVKGVIEALKLVPQLNAQVREQSIVYRNYFDIGIAVGGGKGLVVPIIRSAERLSFAQVETVIADFGRRAQESKLTLEELQGGTFTISNGGVYGSLLSTPIINPPQSGVLGLHAIQDRPVARAGQIVIRPMMYVALTYDHRIVDGREAVTFLKQIKGCLEEPARILLEV